MNQFNTLEVAGFLVAVLLVAVLGFVAGRLSRKNGSRNQIEALEQTLAEERARAAAYREQVGTHFGRSAELFAGMTHSYKNLFDHLAQGYTALGVAETQGEPGFKEQMLALQPDAQLTLTGTATSAAASEAPDPEHTPVITEAEAVYGESEASTEAQPEDREEAAADEATDTPPAEAAAAQGEDAPAANGEPGAASADEAHAAAPADDTPPAASSTAQDNATTPLASEDSSGRREPGLRDEVP